jgi:hypothetical protein
MSTTNKETELARVGGAVAGAHASLRIYGFDLDPADVSAVLGSSPSLSYRRGDPVSPRVSVSRKNGMWLLESRVERASSLDEHIAELLGRVSADLNEWAKLTSRFSADVYCTIQVAAENSGLELTSDTLRTLVARGLTIQFDIYVVGDEGPEGAVD